MAIHRRIMERRVVAAARLFGVAVAAAALLYAVLQLLHMEYQDARAREIGAAAYFE